MSAYDLPTSLTVGGVGYKIRYNWRCVLDILLACQDPDLDESAKTFVMLHNLYPDWKTIPREHIAEACQKACEFIDCGQHSDPDAPKPKLIDWQQDAAIIMPEINKIAGREVRFDPDIHWWTFFGWFLGIGEGLFASVLSIRQKKAKHKKLEKYEEEFYKANRSIIDMKMLENEEIRAEKDNILKYL